MLGLILAGLVILALWRTRLHPLLILLFAAGTWLLMTVGWPMLLVLLAMGAVLGLALLVGLHLRSMQPHSPPPPTPPLTQDHIDTGGPRDDA